MSLFTFLAQIYRRRLYYTLCGPVLIRVLICVKLNGIPLLPFRPMGGVIAGREREKGKRGGVR